VIRLVPDSPIDGTTFATYLDNLALQVQDANTGTNISDLAYASPLAVFGWPPGSTNYLSVASAEVAESTTYQGPGNYGKTLGFESTDGISVGSYIYSADQTTIPLSGMTVVKVSPGSVTLNKALPNYVSAGTVVSFIGQPGDGAVATAPGPSFTLTPSSPVTGPDGPLVVLHFAATAGVMEPGAHVVKKMNAQGVDPDVPELGPSLLRSALHVFTVASAGVALLESGSVSEGAKNLLEGYATDKLVTTVTTDVLGAELASSLIPVVGFAFGLCGDSARSCEEQARMRALGDLQDEIDERAARIVDEEPGAQMSFARERVIRQMLAERGLDKVREQCDPTKACCAKSPDFKIQFNPQMPVLTGNGPSMSARYW
jgi:hypothetical protein